MSLATLRMWATGETVRYLQERLSRRGFHVAQDGSFGPRTYAAVRQFQASEGLEPDGVVGPQTWARLLVDVRAEPPSTLIHEQRLNLLAKIPRHTPKLPTEALMVACNAFGCREEPQGSNRGPEIARFVDGYNEHWQIRDSVRRPWCVMFVSSCIALAMGYTSAPAFRDWPLHPFFDKERGGGAFRGSSADIEQWARRNNRWTEATPLASAAAGSFFTMVRGGSGSDSSADLTAGHAGFIVCDNDDGTVTTIEGNVSDRVNSYVRQKATLRGWATWW